MYQFFAHEGETHAESSADLLSWLQHRPTWQSLLLVLAVLAALYLVAGQLKWKLPTRLLSVVSAAIVIGVLYLPHNATVTAIVLSGGFIATFLLAFTLLGKE